MSYPALPSPKANKSLEILKKNVSIYFQIFAWVAPLVIHSLHYYSRAAEMKVISMNEHSFLMAGFQMRAVTQSKPSDKEKQLMGFAFIEEKLGLFAPWRVEGNEHGA